MAKWFIFHLKILIEKTNIKGILISKHWKEEVVHHILQGDRKLSNRKEENVKRRAPTAYQMLEALSILETFKVTRNRHYLQDPSMLQTTHELLIRKFPIHPNGPISDLPRNKVKENRNRLSRSSPDLKVQNFPWIWNLSRASKSWLTGKHLGMWGRRSLTMKDLREKQLGSVPGVP